MGRNLDVKNKKEKQNGGIHVGKKATFSPNKVLFDEKCTVVKEKPNGSLRVTEKMEQNV